MKIENIIARQILDSRGTPTVEAEVWLEGGVFGRAAVPSGASTGIHEALELRDNEQAFNGKGVLKAVENVATEINQALKGMVADNQSAIDERLCALDGTENKGRLGANAILAVSLATAHAAAKSRGVLLYQHISDIAGTPQKSLPVPMMNVLNGGVHATNSADFQEYMIIPVAAQTYAQAVQIGAEVFAALKKHLADNHFSTTVGDEGGFTLPVTSNTEMLNVLQQAVESAGYVPGRDVRFALDVAASEFYKDDRYHLATESRSLSADEMINYLHDIAQTYQLLSIEDGLEQDQWQDWQHLTAAVGSLQLVGDDLLVTNPVRLQKAIDMQVANAILIKPNQIGTLSETITAVQLAQKHGYNTIISHRSGETEDVTIAHIAVGLGAGQIKTGSLSRSERNAKHNELMRLEAIDTTLQLAQPFAKFL